MTFKFSCQHTGLIHEALATATGNNGAGCRLTVVVAKGDYTLGIKNLRISNADKILDQGGLSGSCRVRTFETTCDLGHLPSRSLKRFQKFRFAGYYEATLTGFEVLQQRQVSKRQSVTFMTGFQIRQQSLLECGIAPLQVRELDDHYEAQYAEHRGNELARGQFRGVS